MQRPPGVLAARDVEARAGPSSALHTPSPAGPEGADRPGKPAGLGEAALLLSSDNTNSTVNIPASQASRARHGSLGCGLATLPRLCCAPGCWALAATKPFALSTEDRGLRACAEGGIGPTPSSSTGLGGVFNLLLGARF